ncbi:MAG: hypothetical protein ACRCU5_15755, partial [Rhizobiaceae bacterium]
AGATWGAGMNCPHSSMRPGIALQATTAGLPDFIGGEVSTVSDGGPGRLIACRKCADCGYSVTECHFDQMGEFHRAAMEGAR